MIEHPKIHGLFFIKGYVSAQQCAHISNMIHHTCNIDLSRSSPAPSKGEEAGIYMPWFQYDPSRYITGCLPHQDLAISKSDQMSNLTDFEVFGGVHPSKWLDLNKLCVHSSEGVSLGANILRKIQKDIPTIIGDLPLQETFKCAFLQLQRMERGVRIMPHIDSDIPKVDLIATACIAGRNIIRIGSVDVTVEEGDLYALVGYARHCVKHEVLSSPRDRLTVTFRYVSETADDSYRRLLRTQLPSVPL